jgi:hypothetical protein
MTRCPSSKLGLSNRIRRPEHGRERKAIGGVRHEVQRLLGWVWCVELATLNLSQRVVAVKNSLSAGWPSPYCHVGILTYCQVFAERLDGDVSLYRRQFPGEMAIAVMQ